MKYTYVHTKLFLLITIDIIVWITTFMLLLYFIYLYILGNFSLSKTILEFLRLFYILGTFVAGVSYDEIAYV